MKQPKPKRLKVLPGHGWRAQPGHQIVVLERGAVRLEVPRTWVIELEEDCLRLRDKKYPDDDCSLGISCHRWPAVAEGLPVADLVRDTFKMEGRMVLSSGPIVEETHVDLALAWSQARFIDPGTEREAETRFCFARKGGVQALLTFDFWTSDRERFEPRWRQILDSLQLAEWVDDPRKGPLLA